MSEDDLSGCVISDSVRFVLDGEVVQVNDVDPNRTVLQFLREDLNRTGTKEGCAEGDCGACTVVLAEIDGSGKRLRARAVNSCIQFLPTLDGKELLTVESLSNMQCDLHPAQQALVDCHGSQCGFCTPGFAMSLFALYKNNTDPNRRQIDEALAGNLCRCTGYKSIVTAAESMYRADIHADDWQRRPYGDDASADEMQRIAKLNNIKRQEALRITGDGRAFFAPRTVDELSALVAQYPAATILAGGTDVGLWVTKQLRSLDSVIYVGNVAELARMNVTDTHIEIGAAVTLTDAMSVITEHYPQLTELFVRFASPPIRNAGTLGGNIANGSPIGDSMPALLALETELVLRRGKSTRNIALADFYVAYQQTELRDGEYVERIHIPSPIEGMQVASYKVSKRFDQDISAVCAAYSLELNDNIVTGFVAAYGGMAAIPSRATECEAALLGRAWNSESIATAMAALDEDFAPLTDSRSSAEYRRKICKNLLLRFFHESENPGSNNVYHYGR